jgi:hypothetical protein
MPQHQCGTVAVKLAALEDAGPLEPQIIARRATNQGNRAKSILHGQRHRFLAHRKAVDQQSAKAAAGLGAVILHFQATEEILRKRAASGDLEPGQPPVSR